MKEKIFLKNNELRKVYYDKDDMWREYSALQACRGRWVQQVMQIDALKNTLHFVYYPQARSFLSFDDREDALLVQLLPDVIRAISHCHARGWVHGDIKPSNILFSPHDNNVRLIDFSASQRIGTNRDDLLTWQATPNFAVKEQYYGIGVVKPGDDWFSLMNMFQQVREKTKSLRVAAQLARVHTWVNCNLVH